MPPVTGYRRRNALNKKTRVLLSVLFWSLVLLGPGSACAPPRLACAALVSSGPSWMTTHQGTAHWTGHALNGSAVSQAAASAVQNTGETPEQLEERRKAWGLYYASQLQAGQTLTPEERQIAAHYLQSQGAQLQAASQQAAAPSASGYQHGAGAMGYNNYSAYYQPHASSSYNYSSGCAQQTGHVIGGAGGQGSQYQQQHLQYQQYQQLQLQQLQQYQQQQREQQWQKPRQAQQPQAQHQQLREPEPPQQRGSGADGDSAAGGCHPPALTPSLTQPVHKGGGVMSSPVSVQASIAAAAAQTAAKIRACQESASAAGGAASPASFVPRSAQALAQTGSNATYGLTPIRTTGLSSTTPGPRSCSSLPSPAAPSPARPDSGQWPAAMRDWIERSFAQCDNDVLRKIVEESMKKRIAAVEVWAHNWEREPLASRRKEPRKEMWYPGCPEDLADRSPRAPRERGARSYGDAFGSGESPSGSKKGKRHKAGKGWDKGWDNGWDSMPPRDAGRGGDELYSVTSDERGRRERRASRFEGSGLSLSERADRWNTPQAAAAGLPALAEPGGGDIELDFTVHGTSTVVEKKYLRLTSAPDPRTVRPEAVLRQALDRIRGRIVEFGELHGQEQYMYLWEQMKSVRQDLTVQRIRNELTVEVYEMHARICLEYNDQAELKQCQAQLAQLYEEGLGTPEAQREFLAYNLLYNIGQQAENNVADLMREMSQTDRTVTKSPPPNLSPSCQPIRAPPSPPDLPPTRQPMWSSPTPLLTPTPPCLPNPQDEFISHALKVRAAAALGHYVAFFRLYAEAPGHAAYVMDTFIGRERFSALRVVCRGYLPTLPVAVVASQLAFDDAAECAEWLGDHGAVVSDDGAQLDCKASKGKLVEHSISLKLEEERKAAERRAESLIGLRGWA